MKTKTKEKISMLTFLALMTALEVVLTRFCSINTIGFKIGFGFVPIAATAILYGPVAAAVVGGLSDLIGSLLFPVGAYFPGFTVSAALIGAVWGLFLHRKKKTNFFVRIVVPSLINNLGIGLLVNSYWISLIAGSHTYSWWIFYRLAEYAVMIPLNLLIIPILERAFRTVMSASRKPVNTENNRMTSEETLAYIHSVTWRGCRPGLERITELCEKLGNPQDSLKFIHIAGTNGKGSTSSMLASVLSAAGYRVGLFTSPFVECFHERIRFCGENISDEELADVTSYIRPFADAMADKPTEFELITAIGLEYYKRKGADYVVFECGLGGRYDSTNVIQTSVLSIITGIDLDHTALLGDTSAKIAWEKAGIIKPGVPVLFGEGDNDAARVIREEAEAKGSCFVRTDYSRLRILSSDLNGTVFTFDGRNYQIHLLGLYQTRNVSNVLTALELLRKQGIVIPEEAVTEGLNTAEWNARFEILEEKPLIVYDGAHNPQGIAAALENIKHYLAPLTPDGKIAILMGVMADKDHTKMTQMLSSYAREVFTVTPANARSLDSREVEREFAENGVTAHAYDELTDGVEAAVDYVKKNQLPLLCLGSLYMYADVKCAVYDAVHRNGEQN